MEEEEEEEVMMDSCARKKKNSVKAKQTVGKEHAFEIDKRSFMMKFGKFHITEDIFLEILLRVPAISLLRFKLVCKKWYSLISNPHFLSSYSSLLFENRTHMLIHGYHFSSPHFYKHLKLFLLPNENVEPPLLKILSPPTPSIFPENYTQNCYLEHSCNGLLLLCFTDPDDFNGISSTYYIFNLITEHHLKLPGMNPMPNITEEDDFRITSHIMFDPSVSLSYKVIRCWLKDTEVFDSMQCQCQLYSSETGSWRFMSTKVPMISFDDNYDFNSGTTMLNGVLYWLYRWTPLDVLYCFDVEKESGSYLPLPPKPIGCDRRSCLYFGECGGRLRLIEKYYRFDNFECLTFPCSFDIMEMDQEHCQDGHSPWILKYHVNMEMGLNCPVVRKHPFHVEIIHCYETKNKGGGEEEVLFLNIKQTSGFEESIDQPSIMSFNLTSNTIGKELTVSNSTTSTSYAFRTFFPFTRTMFAKFMIGKNEKQKT